MKKYWSLLTATSVVLAAWALGSRTTATVVTPASGEQDVGVSAKQFFYHGNTVIYSGDVEVTNGQGTLSCARLTIDLPPEGSLDRQPTNAVAETNVVVNLIKKGDTNHITCDRAIYTYVVLNGTTNDTITFIGSTNRPARVENAKGWMTGEPLIWDNVNGNFSGSDTETHFKIPASASTGTNPPSVAGPLNFLK
jgi:lipopolysaccharide export system protein LptA